MFCIFRKGKGKYVTNLTGLYNYSYLHARIKQVFTLQILVFMERILDKTYVIYCMKICLGKMINILLRNC